MKWNCDPQECKITGVDLVLRTCDCLPSFKTYKVPADTVIKYGAPLKAGANAGEAVPADAGDAAALIGFAYGAANTNAAPAGNPDCDEICVLMRDALIKSAGIAWPAGATPVEAQAFIDQADTALRIVTRQTI